MSRTERAIQLWEKRELERMLKKGYAYYKHIEFWGGKNTREYITEEQYIKENTEELLKNIAAGIVDKDMTLEEWTTHDELYHNIEVELCFLDV